MEFSIKVLTALVFIGRLPVLDLDNVGFKQLGILFETPKYLFGQRKF